MYRNDSVTELKLVKERESLFWFVQRRPCMSMVPFASLGLFNVTVILALGSFTG